MFDDFDDSALLDALDEERGKFDRADRIRMMHMVTELIARGVYPTETVPGNPNTVSTMVDGYGARWFLWREPLRCPHCGADLREHVTGPPYKREIAMYDQEADVTTGFFCPDCQLNLRAGATAWKRLVEEKTPG
jgi:hypothetical protein